MERHSFHPIAWSAWLAAAALPALLTRNPLYLSLTLLACGVTYLALGQASPFAGGPLARSWGTFVRFGALLWLFTIPFTALTVHYGDLVLFRLPAGWPIVGGPITGEALLYGLASGLSIITLLLAFAAFNVAVDQARLLRLTPGFVYQLGIVAAIAVGFVPQLIAAWETIREAQQVHGHKVRGLRDLLPLIIPLLITALERAVHLAESMEAAWIWRPDGACACCLAHLAAAGDLVRPGCPGGRAGRPGVLASPTPLGDFAGGARAGRVGLELLGPGAPGPAQPLPALVLG